MNYLQKNPAQIGRIIHHLILIPPYIEKLQDKVQSRPFLFGRKSQNHNTRTVTRPIATPLRLTVTRNQFNRLLRMQLCIMQACVNFRFQFSIVCLHQPYGVLSGFDLI
jgi:hypothetical protein